MHRGSNPGAEEGNKTLPPLDHDLKCSKEYLLHDIQVVVHLFFQGMFVLHKIFYKYKYFLVKCFICKLHFNIWLKKYFIYIIFFNNSSEIVMVVKENVILEWWF